MKKRIKSTPTGPTRRNYPDIRVRIRLAFSQATDRACKMGRGMGRRLAIWKEDTIFMVQLPTQFAFDLVNDVKDGHSPSADASCAVRPVIINVLTEDESWLPSFLVTRSGWPTSKDSM